ncbi:ATP-binding protein [Paenibacillus arenilitoris]|uniref:ATP-binding protein n=1 Tax=Paenibacillus arenilitoris TaxID=2772299 RepID=UPI00295C007C|nr:ATP-binding protein [Paenibacillus arenilitoris]
MLKEMLLQFILSLLPVFAFQIWYDKDQGRLRMSLFMCIFCSISMVLCMMTPSSIFGYDTDFRLIPYLLGALYGGAPALSVMTILYVAIRLPMLDGIWETISFALFLALSVPLIAMAIRPFQKARAVVKERYAMLIMAIMVLYFIISIVGYAAFQGATWTTLMATSLMLGASAVLSGTWLSVFMVESVKEKQQLHSEVLRVSADYRDEVTKLQQFIDETAFAVIVTNGEGTITHANEMVTKLLALRPEYADAGKLGGVPFLHAFQPEPGDVCVGMLSQALTGEKASMVPYESRERMLLLTAFTLRGEAHGQIAGAALIAHDVTELSQLRNEVGRMERLSLVGQMAASITHEIRNPMAVIRGFVQLIQERSAKSEKEYFRIIMDELDRANMIISDFLSLAQNRALTMQPSSLHDIINELIPLMSADANMRGQTIEVELCSDAPPLMLNDREIKQLLLNLVRNGMEAMGDSGVLRISTGLLDGAVELRIADEGAGIPAEQMKHLFEPFFTTKTRGTGLGLPLCLSIAERHNGRIDVESKEGEGTTFVVSFNLPEMAGGKPAESA